MLLTVLLGFGGTSQAAVAQSLSPGEANCAAARAAFEATLPVPTPEPGRYVVQLVNELPAKLLAGANAAHDAGQPPTPVLPREGTWVLPSSGVLTIDIPEAWEGTIPEGSVGPVFWARTGCRYSVEHNLAQCETGDCGGVYDCSQKGLTPPGPKSLAEWTFRDENGNAAPDISVVDGVNLTMDIVPLGPHSSTPVGPVNPAFWLGGTNLPLSQCGQDLRATCPAAFELLRKDLTFFVSGDDGGDDVVGCFSNCGQYKFQGQLTGACPGRVPVCRRAPDDLRIRPDCGPHLLLLEDLLRRRSRGRPGQHLRACVQHRLGLPAERRLLGPWHRLPSVRAPRLQQDGRLPARGLHQPVFAGPELPAAIRALQQS